jgi:hypothetical protein
MVGVFGDRPNIATSIPVVNAAIFEQCFHLANF